MLLSTLFTISGLAVTLGSAAAIRPRRDADGFQITFAHAEMPSARPGSSQYCGVGFNVTDPITQSSTQCEAEHGPCVGNNVDPPKPEILLDADHPAACADARFTFYLNRDDGIGNYSLAVRRAPVGEQEGRFGITNLINRENYPENYHYNCGGSGFCSSWVSDTVIDVPFVTSE